MQSNLILPTWTRSEGGNIKTPLKFWFGLIKKTFTIWFRSSVGKVTGLFNFFRTILEGNSWANNCHICKGKKIKSSYLSFSTDVFPPNLLDHDTAGYLRLLHQWFLQRKLFKNKRCCNVHLILLNILETILSSALSCLVIKAIDQIFKKFPFYPLFSSFCLFSDVASLDSSCLNKESWPISWLSQNKGC